MAAASYAKEHYAEDIEVLGALIHSEFEEYYDMDLDDAKKLAEKLIRLGWRRSPDSLTAALERRVAELERYARGEQVSWNA